MNDVSNAFAQQRDLDTLSMVGALQRFMEECDNKKISWHNLIAAAEAMYEIHTRKTSWECGRTKEQMNSSESDTVPASEVFK
jgi:hypothetical protein